MTATRSAGPRQLRVEGPLKLTGAARYAADHRPDGVLHAILVGAPVAAGRLRGVDAAAALVLPGVTAVLTAADLPCFPELPPPSAVRVMPFSDDRIRYEGQPVAIVLAESVEAAEAGRAAVIVDCERETPVLIGHGRREPAMGEDEVRGDVGAALAAAAITDRADLPAGPAASPRDGDVGDGRAVGRRPAHPMGRGAGELDRHPRW